jgi:DNA-binding CsgD family transcriptional regulator
MARRERGLDQDALPPIIVVPLDGPCRAMNQAAASLVAPGPIERAARGAAQRAIACGGFASLDTQHDGRRWLAVAKPCGEGAQVLLLPIVIEDDGERLVELTPGITTREREILLLTLRGESARQVSERLGISWHTVRTHLKNVYRTLGLKGRAQIDRLASEALRPRLRTTLGDADGAVLER